MVYLQTRFTNNAKNIALWKTPQNVIMSMDHNKISIQRNSIMNGFAIL